MLARRQKILATLKPYHKDMFAFNFARAFLARTKVLFPHVCHMAWYSLNDITLLNLMQEKSDNKNLCRQIGTLLAGYCKFLLLHKLKDEFLINIDIIHKVGRPTYEYHGNKDTFISFLRKYFDYPDDVIESYMKLLLDLIINPHIILNLEEFVNMVRKDNELECSILLDSNNLLELEETKPEGIKYEGIKIKEQTWIDFYKIYKHIITRVCDGKDWILNHWSTDMKTAETTILNIISYILYRISANNYKKNLELPKLSRFDWRKVFLIFMFDEFIRTGAKTFKLYDFPKPDEKHQNFLEISKMDSKKIPFDESKSLYEILKALSCYFSGYNSTIMARNIKTKIKNFIRGCYDPLRFST